MFIDNLAKIYSLADDIDISEGMEAYRNYNQLFRSIASYFNVGFVQTVAAAVSLSPNNDYMGNLRSLVTVILAVKGKISIKNVKTSTYHHCAARAYNYLTGEYDFVLETTGPKIYNFYCNILIPEDPRFVTIDGHMHNVWIGKKRTMHDSMMSAKKYNQIAEDFKKFARRKKIIPNQLQAILWFTWKRINMIRYNPQPSLFCNGDYWGLKIKPEDIVPFKFKNNP